MKHTIRAVFVAFAAMLALISTSACSEIAQPTMVGVFYKEGQIDGNKFDHCASPGKVDDWVANNSIFWLPNGLRTWNIAREGGDTNVPITVNAKPEPEQPSGVQVNVWTQTNFTLNTYCGGDNKDGNSPLVQWWEKVGKAYEADMDPDQPALKQREDPGWRNMLLNTVVTALTTATRTVIRNYNADPLVAGVDLPKVQSEIGAVFAVELKRLVGGDFYCGPTFDRAKPDCPPVEVIVTDVDYTDAGIQDARNAKVKALEQAAALVAEAEGKVRAADAQKALYDNPAWVELEKAKTQLQAVQACAANPNCTVVVGANGVITTSK